MHKTLFFLLVLIALLLSACSTPERAVVTPTATAVAATTAPPPTAAPTSTATTQPTASPTRVPTQTRTATITQTPTVTQTPTITFTPTITLSPTRDFPDVVVKEQANCRYGPSVAYLYRWGLYEGDTATVEGRNWNGTWYWIKPFNLDSHCWASEIVFKERVDAMALPYIEPRLPKTTFAGPPSNVQAVRNGNQVTITWVSVTLSDDKRRGNMLEVTQCIDGNLIFQPYQTDGSEITLRDDQTCEQPSGALLYTAEKHGYSDPVQVPWPD